ncbi:hypothetical protein SYNPS1DRAFT_22248 [Syncephalis pseudoplumigaleata]|uniref:Uncharacterized protein n=1 Tax=Syncephalis pseudoplumigaleata TaxID=1712513 RepID=A0A4V1J1Q5_9FUNG|nr:hypothetical protein SYNPS1DRAFT_22248 [Syncephalis pseudoplumigaleata]|eukprot:RKP25879.1 hypothetical protein SYNPS1DRAFT_22248 [Syncephalis pseudoplumigaleata]
MSDNQALHDNRAEDNAAAAAAAAAAASSHHAALFSGDTTAVGAPNPYNMDPTAVYRQQSSEPSVLGGEGLQQSHYLPMEPPVGSQPVLGYGMGYVPSQVGGEAAASMYGVPMAAGSASSSQGRNKPAKRKQRCIKYNLTDTCVNSPRKERKKGIKRGPYKRRQKAEHESETGHGQLTSGTAEEDTSFTGNGVGIAGQNLPSQDISYYPAYYPAQQPMIYDPSQLSQAQPGSYYYMSAPPPPPPPSHAAHQLHAGAATAPPPAGYYYPHYYQAAASAPPPPQVAQPPQYTHTFPSGALSMHPQGGQAATSTGASVATTTGGGGGGIANPSDAQQNNNDGSHTFAFPGGLQHTAAVMIAPVIALSPTVVYKRRDSKIDILSELCTAVLDPMLA